MDQHIETLLKVGAAAVLGFAGNTLEEMGGKYAVSGKALNVASTMLLTWAATDVIGKVRKESTDEWDNVA